MSTMILPALFWLTAILIVVSLIGEFRAVTPPARREEDEAIFPSQDAERPR